MTLLVHPVVSSPPGRGPAAVWRRKWERGHDYQLAKALWAFTENRIGVRFRYKWRDHAGNWYGSHGN